MPFPTYIDLSNLGSTGFIIRGRAAGDRAGWGVSSAGDVNDDGIDDLIIGAIFADGGGIDAGEAYVIFGSASGFGTIDLAALTATQGFVIQGDAAGDLAGYSVSTAGDVNGDGIDDLIVGAPRGDDGGSDAGEAYVIFGSTAGFGTIDLATLTPAQGVVIRGDAAGDDAGIGVSNAGDVNGDGIDDLIVGASRGDDGGSDAGEAYVIFGSTGLSGTVDLTTLLPSQGFVIQGDAAGDLAGTSVSNAGDVNGDGIDDLIVGARLGDDGGSNAGEAYVIFGSRAGFGTIDLSTLTAAQGFVIQGDAAGDLAGFSVSTAGDVNGDGIDDLIVGAPGGDDGGGNAGEAYVIFGSTGLSGTVDLTTLIPAQGFIIRGDAASDYAGFSVSTAGDVNGDGIDDLLVSAPYGDNGGASAGEAYVIFGSRAGFGTIDLTSLTAAQGFVIQGDAAFDNAGRSVSAAGDINGDGIDDLVVGAPYGGADTGEAYVIFGQAAALSPAFPLVLDLTGLSAADGFIVQGDAPGDEAGWNVSNAGDINGDGIDDLIVTAPYGDNGGTSAGEAYVIFGSTAGFGTIDLAALTAAQGFIIQGDAAGDQAGYNASAVGDINGDGLDDLIVGAPYGDNGGTDAGEAYVIFGSRAGFGTIDLTSLAAAQGFIIQGAAAGDQAGWGVSNAGDVNGDGMDDLIVGAIYGGASNTGEAYVIFGSTAGFGTVNLAALTPTQGFVIQGDAAGDQAGYSVATAGDINGDGLDDLIVGAPRGDDGGTDAGEAYVIFGSRAGFGTIALATLTAAQGFVIQGEAAGDEAGFSVAAAGDVNGDGIDDLIVGAPYGDVGGTNAGAAYVIYGSRAGFGSIDLATLSAAQGFAILGDAAGDEAGMNVSVAGDVNGDGIDDLIVGAPYGDNGGVNAGEAYVIYGSRAGFATIDLSTLTAAQGFIVQGDAAGDRTAFTVSAAGDLNGDGIDDLAVGASRGNDGGVDAGEAYVIYGRRVNDPGVANDDVNFVLETGIISGAQVSGNDSDPDGIVVVAVNGVGADVGTEVILASGARLTLNADGTYDYDPNGSFGWLISNAKQAATNAVNISSVDSFSYTLDSGDTATVTITIGGVDNAADQLRGDSGANSITGTGGDDMFVLSQGGTDTVTGGAGGAVDRFYFGDAFDSSDTVDGGLGEDCLILAGDYSFTFGTAQLVGIERVRLLHDVAGGDFDYVLATIDANVAIGATLRVDAQDLRAGEDLVFNGRLETNGSFLIFAGAGNDLLVGGAKNDEFWGGAGNDTFYGLPGNDRISGGLGADLLVGGTGSDVFLYGGAAESTGIDFDTLNFFEPRIDKLDLTGAWAGWAPTVGAGRLESGSFNLDLAAALNAALGPNQSILFTPDSGSFAGARFVVVDGNGDGNYTAGADYVFQFTNPVEPVNSFSPFI